MAARVRRPTTKKRADRVSFTTRSGRVVSFKARAPRKNPRAARPRTIDREWAQRLHAERHNAYIRKLEQEARQAEEKAAKLRKRVRAVK